MPVRLIVCESKTDWTVALRWSLAGGPARVETAASLPAAIAMLSTESPAIVALEAMLLGLENSVRAVRDLRERRPNAAILMLLGRSELAWEPWLWEAGAVLVLTSRRNLKPVSRVVQRYAEQSRPATASLHDAVWERMPWGDAVLGTTT